MKASFLLFLVIVATSVYATTMTQTTSQLNLRASPSGEIVAVIPENAVVTIVQLKNHWAEVIYLPNVNSRKGNQGWVCGAFLKAYRLDSGAKIPNAPDIKLSDCFSH